MVNVAIAGATGYGGVELIRLLQAHPQVRLAYLSSESYAGQPLAEVYPHLGGVEALLRPLDPAAIAGECQLAMLALPAGKSMEVVPALLQAGVRVVDVSADFRLRDPAVYQEWYKLEHTCPELLEEAVPGIPEWYRDEIASARLVAAPGCYATAAVLALAPLLAEKLIAPDDIVVDGKSGVSGAGRTSLALPYHYPEANEDLTAYSVGGHRHLPEMIQGLQELGEATPSITFTPHLAPMTRGILLTIYARPEEGAEAESLREGLQRYYAEERFVQVLPAGVWPHTKWTAGTNLCFVAVGMGKQSGRAVVLSALDNLGKGMSGQMVQCLNLMIGAEESTCLTTPAVYP
jgi:N-acetyl-gamma-glutamyl-phosphate reductase